MTEAQDPNTELRERMARIINPKAWREPILPETFREIDRKESLETVDELVAAGFGDVAAERTTLADVQKLHHQKHGEDNNGLYIICDYDKTDWPCRTQMILTGEKSPDYPAPKVVDHA